MKKEEDQEKKKKKKYINIQKRNICFRRALTDSATKSFAGKGIEDKQQYCDHFLAMKIKELKIERRNLERKEGQGKREKKKGSDRNSRRRRSEDRERNC